MHRPLSTPTVASDVTSIAPHRRVRTLVVLGVCLSVVWGCAADIDNVLVRHPLVQLVAHDSAHMRTLVLEPTEGVRIEAGAPPTLLREGGGQIVFTARAFTDDSLFFAEAPSARVTLTRPVNGTLKLRVCPSASECQGVSLPVRTRGRTTRSRE